MKGSSSTCLSSWIIEKRWRTLASSARSTITQPELVWVAMPEVGNPGRWFTVTNDRSVTISLIGHARCLDARVGEEDRGLPLGYLVGFGG